LARPLSKDMADASAQIAAIMSNDGETEVKRYGATRLPPSVADLVYRGLRHWGLAQVRLARVASRPPTLQIQALLAIAWAALNETMREPFIVVDQAAAAAKQAAGPKAAGFVNALLRNSLRDPKAMRDGEQPIAKWNAPVWWIEKIRHDWGAQADALLDALHARAPLTVRLSAGLETNLNGYLERLKSAGLQGRVVGPAAVSIEPPVPVSQIPGFAAGQVSVQDASAQAVIGLFDDLFAKNSASGPKPDVLEACAAPGGKTIALAQRYPATIWALDFSAKRLARLRADLPRVRSTLKAQIFPVHADVLNPGAWPQTMPSQFDAILLDAPCSASGVTRRHPEIAWKRGPKEVRVVADIQRKMLDLLWAKVKPGGELAFVTCSVFLEEGEIQAQSFIDRTPDACVVPSPGRLLPIANPEAGRNQDGFFFAKFKKTPGLSRDGCGHGTALPVAPSRAGQ
jgi:16S rRNA (cytosine967-C5)-methyltransferase